jgi:hypothetical protein
VFLVKFVFIGSLHQTHFLCTPALLSALYLLSKLMSCYKKLSLTAFSMLLRSGTFEEVCVTNCV